jgi:aspartate 4-decarboxylase
MDVVKLREYEGLSPFEIKDFLAKAAGKTASASAVAYLNAGRGNPNWIATEPREAFFLLGQFAITESKRVLDLPPGVGGMPKARGIAERMSAWLDKHADMPGAGFLGALVPWAVQKFGFDADKFVHELVDSIIGDNYPCPTACWCTTSRSCTSTCSGRCAATPRPKGQFKLYAVEGGTAAMCYIFKSMKTNRLLNAGDTIALGTPIFTPYLEMPHLEDYDLKVVRSRRSRKPVPVRRRGTEEAARPEAVKAFFVVNPGNPSAVALSKRRSKIGDPQEAARPDPAHRRRLRHLRAGLPLAAGRLPVQHDRRLLLQQVLRLHRLAPRRDRGARGQPVRQADRAAPEPTLEKARQALRRDHARAAQARFIDRIVADSRDVALNHTAGLSLPQQVMMTLFSLSELMDEKKHYQKACIGIVKKRVEATIEGLGIEVAPNELFDYYYGLIDFEFWARKYVGDDVVRWMKENVHPLDIVFRLAEDHGIVLLNGSGFEAPNWSVRVSFANLRSCLRRHRPGRARSAVAGAGVEGYRTRSRPAARPRARSKRTRESAQLDFQQTEMKS